MFEDLIIQLDELGVPYSEDYDAGTLTIDIADIDKSILIDVIVALNDGGHVFNITDTNITIEGGVMEEEVPEDTYAEDAALEEALTTM